MDPKLYTKSVTGLGMWSAYRPKVEHAELAAALLELGVTWYAPRVGDTAKMFDFQPAEFSEFCAAFKEAGIIVVPWYYSRPTFYQREVDLAATLLELGADGVMIDAEIEWSDGHAKKAWAPAKHGPYIGTARMAEDYGVRMRAAVGEAYIAHCPLAWLAYHGGFPYREFGTFCDQVHPQSYWSELKHGKYDADFKANCLDVWETLAKDGDVRAKNFAPIGVTYGRTEQIQKGQPAKSAPPGTFKLADLRDFLERYERHEEALGGTKRPHSLYSWEARAKGVEQELTARLERMRAAPTQREGKAAQ